MIFLEGLEMVVDVDFKIEGFRTYAKKFIDLYVSGANKCNLPVDRENLESIVDNAEIIGYKSEGSGTFSVNREKISVITNNFEKNGVDRANFLLLHEFSHLNNPISLELYSNQADLYQQFKKRAEGFDNPDVNGLNAYYGFVAIDEVLSQWVCEEINDVQNNKHRGVHSYEVGPLGSNFKYEADFSFYDGKPDVYSPLERFGEAFIRSLGYRDIRSFAENTLGTEKKISERINDKAFEIMCYIGIICKAIYKEEKFEENVSVTKEDVERAFDWLNRNVDFGENGGSVKEIE